MDLVTDTAFLDAFRSAATAAHASGRLPSFFGEIERMKAEVLLEASKPTPAAGPREPEEDLALGVREAAAMFGEPVETFRRRLEFRKALIRRPGEKKLRYSLRELERIRGDRLAGNASV